MLLHGTLRLTLNSRLLCYIMQIHVVTIVAVQAISGPLRRQLAVDAFNASQMIGGRHF